MKKIVTFSAFLFIWGASMSQDTIFAWEHEGTYFDPSITILTSYPVDTVRYGDSGFVFEEPHILNDIIYYPGVPPSFPGFNNNIAILKAYDGGSKTTLYGIAFTAFYFDVPEPDDMLFLVTRDENGTFVAIDSIPCNGYRVDKIFDYHITGPDPIDRHMLTYFYELYFDQPHVVQDTFYIGTFRNRSNADGYLIYGPLTSLTSNPVYLLPPDVGDRNWYRVHNPAQGYWGMFFPIVQPDRLLCGGPEEFRIEELGNDYALLSWHPTKAFEDIASGRYQIALGGLGAYPDTTNILTFSDTVALLSGLDTGVWYSAWVRSECDHQCPNHNDTLLWSQWRGPLQFYLYSDTTLAIPNSQLSPLTFHLYPNPSTGDVTVFIPAPFLTPHSSFLTVFDASGREVIPPTPLTSHLSHLTFHLPDGIYLVRVTTPHGTATQKLTIAR